MKCQLKKKNESETKTVVEDWGTLTWLASAELTSSHITVGRVVIKQGRSNPRHCHDNCEEVLYLLQGELKHSFGDEFDKIFICPFGYHTRHCPLERPARCGSSFQMLPLG